MFKGLGDKIEQTSKDVLREYANRIYTEALSNLRGENIKGGVRLVSEDDGNRWVIYTDNEIAAYIEFGTGQYAAAYLSGKPQEMVDEAIKFYVNGEGNMPASPWLFPAYYKYRDEISKEFDRRVQRLFDTVKF